MLCTLQTIIEYWVVVSIAIYFKKIPKLNSYRLFDFSYFIKNIYMYIIRT